MYITELCVNLVIYYNYTETHGHQNMKNIKSDRLCLHPQQESACSARNGNGVVTAGILYYVMLNIRYLIFYFESNSFGSGSYTS